MTATAPQEAAIEEAFLLAKIGVRDARAFNQLYHLYAAPLYSLGIRMLGNPADAEEALQDSFVKIWNNAADFDVRKSRPFTWAVTIMRRTCIDRLRKLKRDKDFTTFEAEKDQDWAIPEKVRQTVEGNEARDRIEEVLKDIPENQKRALELALFSEMTHSEIASTMQQPLGTIKSWLKRGLFQLRNTLT